MGSVGDFQDRLLGVRRGILHLIIAITSISNRRQERERSREAASEIDVEEIGTVFGRK